MFLVDQLILLGGALLIIGIVSSKFSTRLGLPVLVLFLAVGMLAGEDGFGRIEFDNFRAAHAIGTVALAVILFDGGLQTRTAALRLAWKPAALLATVGVLVTGLREDRIPDPAVSLELMTLRDVNADIVDYAVVHGSSLVGKTVKDLELPDGAVLAMISRAGTLIAPRGSTRLQPADHLFVIARADTRRRLDEALGIRAD